MSKIISKTKLLATTAICAISVCANTVKAEEIDILSILNNSTTKSPNISWEKVTSAGTDTIQIGDEYFKYTWTNNDSTWGKYTERQSSLSGDVKADFIGISSSSNRGGAIYNISSIISSITGDFVGNSGSSGGAISNNSGRIYSITGDFIGNSATSTNSVGGAIHNDSTIVSITGDFTGNSVNSTGEYADGGAIYNQGTISSITGDFTGNRATGNYAYGGAIYNTYGTIETITGDFKGNSATSTVGRSVGGAIYNLGTIGDIIGDFVGNSASYGGAIHNNGTYIYNDGIYSYQYNTISNITGDFIGNSASYGGAIYGQYSSIETITGDFIGNSATSGGAIYNDSNGTISSITGDFINNRASSGGAIYNQGTISSITGDFTGNSVTGEYAYGGAIYNISGTILSITGNFESNSATSTNSYAKGGAIYNTYTLSGITGDFTGNSVTGEHAYGGAIYSYGTITSIIGNFDSNSATSTNSDAYGGAIYNDSNGTISSITGDFIGNSASSGGAISNYKGAIESITGDFEGNSATSTNSNAYGGAIYNNGTISSISGDFIGNYAKSADDDYDVGGGAIYNNGGTIGFVADASDAEDELQDDIMFQGNYTQSGNEDKKYEAIYNNNGTINFESRNGGSYTFYDSIYNSGTINLTGDDNGIFNMYNDIEGWGTFNIKNSYTFNMVNQEANLIEQNYFNIEAESSLNLDVILSTGKSDRFSIDEITGADKFELKEINLVDDMLDDVEYEKVVYSNQKLTGNEFTREQSTSKGKYSIVNDGQNLIITKVGESLGFASFLYDVHDEYTDYTYSFTEDENMEHILIDTKYVTGDVQPNETKITVFGNNHTLNYLSGEKSKAMNLKKGQTATINDLTIKDFETGLINNGEMTLNNVAIKNSEVGIINSGSITLNNITLTDNKVALQNSGDISLQGENTISGSDYAMYFEAGKSYEYPLYGAIGDMEFISDAMEEGISYAEYVKNMSEEASASIGQKIEFTNAAEYFEVYIDFVKQQGADVQWNNELEFFQTEMELPITEAQYNEALEAMKQYGEAHPAAGYVAYISLSYGVSPLKFTQLFYSEDASEQEALLDELAAEMFANLPADEKEGITEAEVKQELIDMIAEGKPEMAEMENMYAQVGAPSPYEYVAPAYKESTFDFAEGAILNLNSKVSGEIEYGLTLAGADDAIINLNSEIEKADLVLDGPTLKLSDESTNLASVNSFEVKNGMLDMQNEVVRKLIAPNFKVSGPMSLYVDADLANKTMDTLGKVEVLENGSISVDGIKIISDSAETEALVEFAEESYKDKVTTTVDNVLSAKYEYAVEYDKTTGDFKFVRAEEKAPESVTPNLEVPAAGGITQTIVDVITNTVLNRDVSAIGEIKYDPSEDVSEEVTISAIEESKKMRGWVQFLHSEDDVELKNAEDSIDAKFSGLLGGIESKVYTYENGWKAMYGIYGSYVTSTQEFGDTEIDQTGEYYGLHGSFRKGKVFSNLTLTRGFIENEAQTEWGTDKFDTTLLSVSGKAGVDLHKPSLTLTPAIYVAYTQVDTEDYTNKAGIEIENELTHVVTIAPELKLTKNFEEGLNGYAKVSYKTFMYSNNEVKADGVLLPEMSVKPYMEYSVGAEWVEKDNTTLYGEVSRHTGGREGWNLNLGLRLNF